MLKKIVKTHPKVIHNILKGHTDEVNHVQLDYHRNCIMSASFDKTLRVWKSKSGKPLQILQEKGVFDVKQGLLGSGKLSGHNAAVWTVAFDMDTHVIVSGGTDGIVRLWDLQRYKLWHCKKHLSGHSKGVIIVRLDGPNDLLFTGSADHTIMVWKPSDGSLLATLVGHTGYVNALDFGDKYLVSGSSDGTVRVWDKKSFQMIKVIKDSTDSVYCVKCDESKDMVMSCGADGFIYIHRISTGQLLRSFKAHENSVNCITFDAAENLIVTGSADQTLVFWDYSKGKAVKTEKFDAIVNWLDVDFANCTTACALANSQIHVMKFF